MLPPKTQNPKTQTPQTQNPQTPPLGLRANWRQFSLLVLINAFVGGMVGMERSILPEIAAADFGIAAHSAILSFIVAFGLSKAAANYYAGRWANRIGRKRLLVIGWLLGLPVPFLLMYAPSWGWIVATNLLLGLNQGLAWSSTVVMKIDLAGPRNRGLAMGLNESAGYLAVGGVALLTGYLASSYGLRPYPFYLGAGLAILGLLMSWLLVRDTAGHVQAEQDTQQRPPLRSVFRDTSWRHPSLGAITQAGLVNNLNDGMVWGLLPLLLATRGFDLAQIGQLVAIYPAVWGLGQLATGKLADHFPKKPLLVGGMAAQGLALLLLAGATTFWQVAALSALLGLGTAVVYPTFLAGVSDYAPPQQRAESIGVFRLWRDLGYAVGALLTGLVADSLGLGAAVLVIAGLTLLSAAVVQGRMGRPLQVMDVAKRDEG